MFAFGSPVEPLVKSQMAGSSRWMGIGSQRGALARSAARSTKRSPSSRPLGTSGSSPVVGLGDGPDALDLAADPFGQHGLAEQGGDAGDGDDGRGPGVADEVLDLRRGGVGVPHGDDGAARERPEEDPRERRGVGENDEHALPPANPPLRQDGREGAGALRDELVRVVALSVTNGRLAAEPLGDAVEEVVVGEVKILGKSHGRASIHERTIPLATPADTLRSWLCGSRRASRRPR